MGIDGVIMGRPQTKKKQSGCNRKHHMALKLKHYARDVDQIHGDLPKRDQLEHQPVDEDLPGAAQHYCVECARYFVSDEALKEHKKEKTHKKRLRELKDVPYSQKEAEFCSGMRAAPRSSMQVD